MKYSSEIINQVCNKLSLVDYISQYTTLEKKKEEYWCCCPLPNHDEDTPSFSIKNNKYYCFGCGSKGNIINFYMEYHKKSFPQAMEELIKLANIDINQFEYSNILEFLRTISSKKSNKDILERTFLSEDVINQYTKEPIKEWLSEGIIQEVLDKYNVRYNKPGNAIVYPIRDIEGRIIAIKARTLFKNYKDLGIPKYIYYQPIGTNDFLFGLYQNFEAIKIKNECIILEGAKGIFLAESYGYYNAVSLETNHINENQINLLLSLRCNIVFALDKGVKLDFKALKLLSKFTNVYIMEDKQGLLINKDCPADRGKEIFDRLYEGKYKI